MDSTPSIEMEKQYDPHMVEERLYNEWEGNGYFIGKRDPSKKPFTIVMPPPNITGQLHMGHALDTIPQDILTRYHRMKGDAALWVPGTDHASIATEVKIVEALAKEGVKKQDLGREKFLERAWKWKAEYGGQIAKQLRKLGASCDWSRERFTMDEGCNKAVVEVFVRLFDKGLIYRGDRIINWCPVCKTALSDAEVEYAEQSGHLYHIRYSGEHGDVVVATTRPETMLGDTGVAVHPNDSRYSHIIGKTVRLPLMNRDIPVVADEYVDMKFGTGAVKMTPAHDPNDFEVGQRQGLPILRVMNDDGTMNENAGRFAGLTREKCRSEVVAELQELGVLVKIEDYVHNVGSCYRCHSVVEPLISLQWFVNMRPLAEPAIEAVKSGKTRFIPERFNKIYFNWMENIRDWCISRQLWWGHRIPAYYCENNQCAHMLVAKQAPQDMLCPKCKSPMRQDEDVLDTWFSSALWPFSTLGWPDDTEDLRFFYPTNVLACGYDILFFWVARMIFSGIEQMGETPFQYAYQHGLVRDKNGKKMSKSLGNGIDPLEVIETMGTDALRFSLTYGVAPGGDIRLTDEKLEAARNFTNKLWNASRFVMMNLDGYIDLGEIANPESGTASRLQLPDKWILSRYQQTVDDVTRHIEEFDFGIATQKLYDFIWDNFCDWYIELVKTRLFAKEGESSEIAEDKRIVQAVLQYVLSGLLKLLHPFMPFVTDEVYRYLPRADSDLDKAHTIMLAEWPKKREYWSFETESMQMEAVMEVIRAVRTLRAEMNVPLGKKAALLIKPTAGYKTSLMEAVPYFIRLSWASRVEFISDTPDKSAQAMATAAQIYLPMGDLIDVPKELTRAEKELGTAKDEISRLSAKLSNESFISKAPQKVVDAEREKLSAAENTASTLQSRIEMLKSL